MPAANHPSSSLAALSDKEREVLNLLATGHTVKSIAAQLGRSEPSINERLRDARRKTGIGSSRELARLLNAQKSWDKNIDLPLPAPPTDDPEQPTQAGRAKSKGTIIMLFAVPIAAIGLVVAATQSAPQSAMTQAALTHTAGAVAAQPSPLVGKWSLDVSRIPANERPQRVTIAFSRAADEQWTTHVEVVGPDGVSLRADSTAAANGVPVMATGTIPSINTVALRQPAPGTLVMTLGKDGAPVSTRVYTVAKDGKTMTETIIWASTGVPKLETTYFNRVG